MSWTPDRVAELERLAGEGLTAAQIACELGDVSRNAVIGKMLRCGFRLARPPRGKGVSRPKAPRSAMHRPATPKPRRLVVDDTPPVVPAIEPGPLRRPDCVPVGFLTAVEHGLCLHFIGDPYGPSGPDMPVCGAARAGVSRYCAFHLESRVAPPRERRPAVLRAIPGGRR